MIRTLIADDHELVRKGIRQILEANGLFSVDEASDSVEVLQILRNDIFDIILLDIGLPRRNGLDLLVQLKSDHPALPVLVLSMHPEEQYALRCLKSGAKGYMHKNTAPELLISAIKKILEGGKYISETFTERFFEQIERGAGEEDNHLCLSGREFDVFCRIAKGETLSEIAQNMLLSVKTISTYRSRIMEKMNFRTNADLTFYALKYRLIE